MAYCGSRYHTVRRLTREVMVGDVGVGGRHPIRVQSMTTSNTQDVAATVRQSIALAEVGCEIVRITAPNVAAARCLKTIRQEFSAAGFGNVPLVADIHFMPAAAMAAVEHVEKVRVNPGNYADHKKFAQREYSDGQYREELERLHKSFSPLVLRCKELGRSMRIGTNHGSLSDRIMNRYGDTPLGMVESALEFIRICESHGFRDIILSMKASNPKVMIQAYRLLVVRMAAEDMAYPLHLGVTEAGDGEDGRIKSAIGIGSLLWDGLGDTIRVSLTEDSVYEIPVAQALAAKAMALWQVHAPPADAGQDSLDPYAFNRRVIAPVDFGAEAGIRTDLPPRVIVSAGRVPAEPVELSQSLQKARPLLKDTPIEGLLLTAKDADDVARVASIARGTLGQVACLLIELPTMAAIETLPPMEGPKIAAVADVTSDDSDLGHFLATCRRHHFLPVVGLHPSQVAEYGELLKQAMATGLLVTLHSAATPTTAPSHAVGGWRRLAEELQRAGVSAPLWIRNTPATAVRDEPAFLSRILEASVLTGALLADGLGDVVSFETDPDLVRSVRVAYNLLQGAGSRISKTEFVACPSCGRTLFDLQSTTQRIREKTGHLKGVKIAIMGCIVNGPGEMADADFGYVGGAPGKINLYVGKECVRYGIPAAEADERLIDLIREHGKWFDPEPTAAASA